MRWIPTLTIVALTACVSETQEPQSTEVLHVAPAADGEWDDPDAAGQYRAFTTIQDAIDASTGAAVVVPSGTYFEDIVMKPGVDVEGAGRGETWIVGSATFPSSATPTKLSRLSMADATWFSTGTEYTHTGVEVVGGDAIIEDVGLHYFGKGIRAHGGATVEVRQSHMSRNWYGAVIEDSLVIFGSNLVASNEAGGIAVYDDAYGEVAGNTFVGNAFAATSSYLVGAISMGPSTTSSVVQNNIVVSNYYGMDCSSCDVSYGHNLVWGNTTDYINDAGQHPDDLPLDPRFVNPTEGDLHLTPNSPAIDAGAAVGLSVDFEGEVRPQGAAADIGMDEFTSTSYALQITEVVANAATESTGEFVEIYNAGSTTVELAGLVLSDGDDPDSLVAFGASGSTVGPGKYAVVVDPDYASDYTIDAAVPLLTTTDRTIGNGLTTSDRITLFEGDGTTIIATFSYPRDPGDGVSMEMIDLDTGDAAGNWRASACTSESSPGAGNCFPPSGAVSELVITEVMSNPKVEASGEFIELYNPTDLEIDAVGLILDDGDATDTLQGFQGGSTLIGPRSHALILDAGYDLDHYLPTDVTLLTTGDLTLGNGLTGSDPITLYEADGTTVIDTYANPFDPGDGRSVERVDYDAADTSGNWQAGHVACARGKSPGRLNGAAGGTCGVLQINEVMANPLDEDTGEFVELYNPGPDTVNLAGLLLTDGTTLDALIAYQGGSTLLGPDSFALIIDSEYDADYTIAPGTVVVRTADTTLGNGLSVNDEVVLLEADGVHRFDAYRFPSNPGNGTSVERVDRLVAGDYQDNWVPSTCASGASPGADNCVTSSASGFDFSDLDLHITEVMANPLDEQTGEFIEIFNSGSQSIDLLGFVLYDGDALDTLFGLQDPYDTVLAPGQRAVILDRDYVGQYTIPAAALRLTTDDSTIGSGLSVDDPVWLFEPDAQKLVDSYTYPSNPGNGVSVEKQTLGAGDTPANWAASTCPTGSSPGRTTGSCP